MANTHAKQLVSTDIFVVPTVTFRVLYVFVVLAHERRRLLHFNVTFHPSSEWAAQQMVEALPWGTVPRYLLRDRDAIYGESFPTRVRGMGVREVLTAPQSPWQNPYAERLIGSFVVHNKRANGLNRYAVGQPDLSCWGIERTNEPLNLTVIPS